MRELVSRARRALLAALVAALLAGGLASAPPAAADQGEWWEYDVHAAGMPTTTDPARTLVSASVMRYYEGQVTDAEVSATAELAAEPDASTDSTLHLLFGVTSDAGCEPRWEFSLPTYDPGTAGARSGTTVTFEQPVPPEDVEQWTCSYVELLDPADTTAVHDRLDGRYETTIVIDPPPGIIVKVRDDGCVPVGRWVALRLRLAIRSDTTRVVVDGWARKPGVRVWPVVLLGEELDDKLAWLPVRLGVREPRTLRVRARAWNVEGDLIGRSVMKVRLRPRC